jgi:uncharacterized membrane protein YcaP (DUF421 family)
MDGRSRHILFDQSIGNHQLQNRVLLAFVALMVFLMLRSKEKATQLSALRIILVFIGVTIVGTAIYQHSVFDHYILFIMPAVYLLHGKWISKIFQTFINKAIFIWTA